MINIGPDTELCRNPSQVFNEIDGEVVMLNVDKGSYYALNEVGSTIWKELTTPLNLNELVMKLRDIYDVSSEHCLEDIETFLSKLLEAKIIQISNA